MDNLKSIIFIDVETTGLSDERNEIIEIGAIIYTGDAGMSPNGHLVGTPIERQTLIKPNVNIPANITRITGISNDDVSQSPNIKDAVKRVMNDIPKNAILVAHNAPFDVGFIMQSCLTYGDDAMRWIKSMKAIDTLSAYRKSFKGKANLGAVCENFGIDVKNAHRAIGDCCVMLIACGQNRYLQL